MKKFSVKIPLWIALACCIVSAIPRNQHTLFSGVLVGISCLIVCCIAIMRRTGIVSTITDNDKLTIVFRKLFLQKHLWMPVTGGARVKVGHVNIAKISFLDPNRWMKHILSSLI